ncbi:unnamed protein product [Adineta steineri]|uniref:Uncharacterized protein n=1 Tax=Adineta steineri TaxID=433720 RepID=A0A814PUD4_9BILA|nr:unnamed protein product [Adineta steineri]
MTEDKVEAILSQEQLKTLFEDYRQDKKNLLAQSACCQQSLTDVIVDRQTRFSSAHVFNTKSTNVLPGEWFDEYLYEVVVDKKHLSKEVLAVLDQEPIILKAWDPMGALACSNDE